MRYMIDEEICALTEELLHVSELYGDRDAVSKMSMCFEQ